MTIDEKKRDYFPEKEVQQKLDEYLQSGQQLIHEQDVPLTQADISTLKSMFAKATLGLGLVSVPFLIVIYFFQDDVTVIVICGAIVLLLLAGIVVAAIQMISSLRAGKKTVLKGIITDRFTRTQYGPRDEDGKRAEKVVNFFKIGTREIEVNKAVYDKHKTGEGVELHFILSRKGKAFFLFHKVMK